MTTYALQRDRRTARARRLPRAARRAAGLPRGPLPDGPSVRAAGRRCPGGPSRRSRGCSGPRRRARSGPRSSACPTPSPTSSTRKARRSRPATAALPALRAAAGAAAPRSPRGCCAPTPRRRRGCWRPRSRMAFKLLRRGRLIPVPPPEKAVRFLASEGERARRAAARPPRDRRHAREGRAPRSRQLAADYGADEVIVVTITYDHAARRRSYELLAEAFDLPGVPVVGGAARHR